MNKFFAKLLDALKVHLKKSVITMIFEAESGLPGATGKEKRAYVVQHIDDLLVLPWYLEAFDGPAAGLLVDLICDKLNILTDHDKMAVAEVPVDKLSAVVEATDEELSQDMTVEEKLESLYKKYKV